MAGNVLRTRRVPRGRAGHLEAPMRRAFTLIELLVVIAIIAVLAAMLFPVLARAREMARRSTCTSNLHQQGAAIMMYAQDFDEVFPVANFNDVVYGFPPQTHRNADGTPIFFVDLLQPYCKSRAVFICPTVRGQAGRAQSFPTDYNYMCAHGWNLVPGFSSFNNDLHGVCSHPVAAIGRAAEKPMIVCDAMGEHVGEASGDVYAKGKIGAQNMCYVDGHVKLTPGTYRAIVALYMLPNN